MSSALGSREQRIYDSLNHNIVAGDLAPGTRLAPQVDLAADFGIALMRMRRVIDALHAQGLLVSRRGMGNLCAR